MVQPYVNSYIGSLQNQIADVASRIKQKQNSDGNASPEKVVVTYEVALRSDVEALAYKLIGSEVVYETLGMADKADCAYATGAYGFADKVDKTSSVIEGLVFKNNKEFDFKV